MIMITQEDINRWKQVDKTLKVIIRGSFYSWISGNLYCIFRYCKFLDASYNICLIFSLVIATTIWYIYMSKHEIYCDEGGCIEAPRMAIIEIA